MIDREITLREYRGRSTANLLNFLFELVGDDKYRKEVIPVIEEHKYIGRKKTDSNSHPRSKRRKLSEVPDPRIAKELARFILESMETQYSAPTSNRMKQHLLEALSE